jgi:hypothetical protein
VLLKPVAVFLALLVTVGVVARAGPLLLEWRYATQLEGQGVTSTQEALEVALRYQHEGSATTAAGSALETEITDYSPTGILTYLPGGMFTALFRPLPFEAHNALALVAALENTLLLGLVVWRIRYLVCAGTVLRSNGLVAFSVVVFLLVTVILSFSRNFGVIVRQRSMALPFLVLLLGTPRRTAGPVPETPEGEGFRLQRADHGTDG